MIAVEGDVVVESAAVHVRLRGSGSTLTAHLDGAVGLPLLRNVRRMVPLARAIVPLLVRAGLTVDVFAGGVRVARAGNGVEADRFARLFHLANVRISG